MSTSFLAKIEIFIRCTLTCSVAAYVACIVYIFRYSIWCGKGVGVYAVLGYVPFILSSLLLYVVFRGNPMSSYRLFEISVLLLSNLIFMGMLMIVGICFSCVNQCVENYIL